MAQRYKLRLSDGTFMSVDLEGLRAWVDDAGALAQSVGSQQWRPLREVLADEESALRLLRALVPPQARQPATPPPPAGPQPREPLGFGEPALSEPTPAFGEPVPPLREPAFNEPSPAFREPPVTLGAPRDLQVLADEPVSARSADPAPSDDAGPVIRLKPPDEQPHFRSAWEAGGEAEELEEDEERRQDRLEGPLLTVLESFGGWLSRLLDRLAPLVRGVRFGRAGELAAPRDEPAPRESAARPSAARSAPAPVMAVAEDLGVSPESERRAETAERPSLYARASGWLRGLRGRETEEEEDEAEQHAVAPLPRPAKAVPSRLPREPVQAPPPPVKDLPVVPFAPSREPREQMDVYQGEREPFISFSLAPLWLWTKRIVVLGGLAALGAYAFLERDTWFPKAADLGQKVFTEVDRQVLSRQRNEQQRQALVAASERLPQLAPETIQLFFARSPTGVVEAAEVFELARAAADRGRASLTGAKADELRGLERELVDTLRPVEREQVREYDRNRTRRPIFPFENPHVMELVAQGARLLPPERRARLQALTQEAVAAGIGLPDASPAPDAAR